MRTRDRFFRGAAVALRAAQVGVALAILIAAAAGVPRLERMIKSEADKWLVASIESRAGIGAVRVELFGPAVALEDVSLAGADGSSFFAARRVRIVPDLFSLVRGKINISSIEVSSPVVTISMDGSRITNLPSFRPKPDDNKKEAGVTVRRVVVRDGSIAFNASGSAPWDVAATLGRIDADIDIEQNALFIASLRAGAGRVGAGEAALDVRGLALDASVEVRESSFDARVDRFELEADGAELELAGGRLSTGAGGMEASLKTWVLAAPLGLVSALFPSVPDLGGALRCNGDFEYDAQGPVVDARCSIDGLHVSSRRIGRVSSRVIVGKESVRLTKGRIETIGGAAGFDGRIGLAGEKEFIVNAGLDGASFASAMSRAGVDAAGIDFLASGPVTARGELAPFRLYADLDLLIEGFEAMADGGRDPAATMIASLASAALRSSVEVDAERVVVHSAVLKALGSTVEADGWITFQGLMDLALRSPGLEGADVQKVAGIPVAGSGSLGLRVWGEASGPRVAGSASVRGLAYGGTPVGDVKLHGSFNGKDRIDIASAVVKKGRSEVRVSGGKVVFRDAKKGGPLIEAEVDVGRLFVSDVRAMLGKKAPGVMKHIEAEAKGTAKVKVEPGPARTEIAADLDLSGVSVYGEAFETGSVKFHYAGKILGVEELKLEGKAGAVTAGGTMSGDGLDFSAEVSGVRCENLKHLDHERLSLSCVADAAARIEGTVKEPVVSHATVHVRQTFLAGRKWKDSTIELKLEKGLLTASGMLMGDRVEAHALTDLHNGAKTDIFLRIDGLAVGKEGIAELSPAAGKWLEAVRADGEISASVIFGKKVKVGGTASFTRLEADVSGNALRNTQPVKLAFTGQSLKVESAAFGGEGTSLRLAGGLNAGGPMLTVEGRADLALLEKFFSDVEEARGSVTPDISISGKWENVSIVGKAGITCDLARLSGDSLTLTGFSGKASFSGNRVKARLAGNVSARPAGIELGGRPVAGNSQLLKDLDPFVEASVEIEAEAGDWGRTGLSGKAVLSSFLVRAAGRELRNKAPLKLGFTADGLTIEELALAGEGTDMTVSGSVGRIGPDLSVKGTVDMGILKGLAGGVEQLEGRLSPSLRLSGTWKIPEIAGIIGVQCDALKPAGGMASLSGVSGKIKFSKTRVLLDLEGGMGGGSFTAQGHVVLKAFRPDAYAVAVKFDTMSVKPAKDLSLSFDGQLAFSKKAGKPGPGLLSGDVWVRSLTYTKDFVLAEQLEKKLVKKGAVKKAAKGEAMERFRLDIAVHGSGPMVIRNNFADAHFFIDESLVPFRVTGTDAWPGVTGRVVFGKGDVWWMGRKLSVTRGIVELSNPSRVEPRFDIEAGGEIKGWQVYLAAQGTPDDFSVSLWSSPQLPEEDILTLLQFGMTRSDLAVVQNAGMVTADLVVHSLGLERNVKGLFPVIDQFSVKTEFSKNSNSVEPTAVIGKDITKKVKISASSGLTRASFKAGVEYRISGNLSVEAMYEKETMPGNVGQGSDAGNIGVDLKWHFEF